ncbi:SWIM zinc finger family protein [Vreelandella zhaodongensis]|uniref:SWIM zinc finger family protein n=1 Tax=Vreelandella zhaodongensis TaxID=1176240 RepID=UPI003EB9F507
MDEVLFSDAQLVRLAGEAAFGRGVEYYQQRMVTSWGMKGSVVTAKVEGSELYHVKLTLTKCGMTGECSCPASEGIDFCKHCVAVALVCREDLAKQNQLAGGDTTDRIQAYLEQFDKPSLVETLLSLIEHDPALQQQCSLRADAALGVLDHKALKKRITAAFPINKGLFRYNQVSHYFTKAEIVIEQLAEQLPQLPPEKSLALVDYAIARMSKALETIDDSGGFRYHCEHLLHTMHIQTVQRLDWPAEKLAGYLYEKAFEGNEDLYPTIPDAYLDVLSEASKSTYYERLQQAWDTLPTVTAASEWEKRYRLIRLRDPLLKRAKAAGDLAAILALYQKTTSDERDCLEAAEQCIEYEAWDLVEAWLVCAAKCEQKNNALWRLERNRLEIRLKLHRGEAEAAAEQQWGIYQHTQQLEDYQQLVALMEAHNLTVNYRQRACDWLLERITHPSEKVPFYLAQQAKDSLLEIYLFEGRLNDAQALCAEHPVSAHLLYQLAKTLPSPDAQIPLYLRLVRLYVEQTNKQGYRQGIALLRELKKCLETSAQHTAFAQLLTQLRNEFKAKRNFIKWLNEAFPDTL